MREIAPWLANSRWSTVPIRYLAKLGTGHTPSRQKPEYWKNCTIPWITLADVWQLRDGTVGFVHDTKEKISSLGLANSAAVKHPAGTVILSRTASVGFSAIMGKEMATSQDFVTWTCGPHLNPKFLLYVLRAMAPDLRRVAAGSTHKTIYMPDIEELRTPLPPLDEQRRISHFLGAETDVLDRSYRLKSQLKNVLHERLSAVRASVLDELINKCGELPLRRFVTTIEQGASPVCDAEPASGCEWGVLKLSSVKRGRFDASENKRLSEGAPLAKYEVRDGDLLVTRANTPDLVGDVAVVRNAPNRKLLPDLIYRVGLTDRMDPDFVAEVLLGRWVRGLIEASARGSSQSMVKLRGEDIMSWPIPNADQSFQRQFVERMRQEAERIRRLDDAIGRQHRLLDERRRTLITAAVTGQLDVTKARYIDPS